MRLWLASYPRSGNTFLRMVLSESFGIASSSVYGAELVDQWLDTDSAEGGIRGEDAEMPWTAVKTHEAPLDDGPAIYVVRDGRAAVTSYFHYLSRYESSAPSDVSLRGRMMTRLRAIAGTAPEAPQMRAIVRGDQWPGSWSWHFEAWSPLTRPNTLLLRYEDMLADIDGVCEQISSFLGVPQLAPFQHDFAMLHAREPGFFRSGDNQRNIAELAPYMDLFNQMHGTLMRELGYAAEVASVEPMRKAG